MADLILKHLYFETELKSIEIAERIGLPFGGVTEPLLSALKADRSVEIRGGESTMSFSWRYVLTSRGSDRAKDALSRSFYVGKAPVSMYDYYTMVTAQAIQVDVGVEQVREAYQDLIVTEDLLRKIGPAVSSNKSIFMYGPPGNGKTSIAERIFRVLSGTLCVPYAVEIDGHVIKLYDPFYHQPLKQDEPQSLEAKDRTLSRYDCRWNLSRRPFVVVGGELTLETLDLIWNDSARYYEAPFQLKSNGGILLIDDFGRQVIKPQDLLNRWIVPLEKGIDYLTLHTGKKFEVPFRQLVVFSTNLNPADLVDEAFLRRLRYKIEIPNPTPEQFVAIFQAVCQHKGVAYDEATLAYLMHKYDKLGVEPRSCHPRDLIDIIMDEARFRGIGAQLSPDNIDLAWASYFVTYK
ncbi:MAG: AAA family ATPase [Candidatus Wallbacteria bacterium]|nr:AAA family ATPase [Candidatus Wallbacteria bacterium]